ncbi:glycolate oxidase subunit GlcD [Thermocladium modestius]|uniref:Glycolate oxidase subunit GlcD n=1 Tax=Thermocladium modestius TaxID=62609 RepID=A0A830GS64_9CREN|nr:FAD-binding oxidoreductase [Thermocladium modestius]GGP19997.1 glycolate oxidase subunit GlcD [Thermocladium modestius]
MDVIEEMRRVVGPGNVLTKKEDILPYMRDASYLSGGEPLAVVIPGTTTELAKVVKACYEAEVPMYVRGGGTSLTGSSVPLEGGVVISMNRFDKILEVSVPDRYVVAEAGVRLDALNAYLSKFRYFYPPDPASSLAATVGGSLSTNAGGMRGAMYGATKEWVLGMEVVLPTGEVAQFGGRVLKRSIGYDLTALMIGSEGTLGIITKATLKITPLPRRTGRILAYYKSIEDAGKVVARLTENGIIPYIAEFMDGIAMDAAKKSKGIDYPSEANYMMIIDIASTEESIKKDLESAADAIRTTNPLHVRITTDPEEMDRIYQARKGLYSSLLMERARPGEKVIIGDVVVPPTEVPSTLVDLDGAIKRYGFKVSLFGHIGDGNVHLNIFANADDEEEMRRVSEFLLETGMIAVRHGGSVSAEHGIGLEKKQLLVEEFKARGTPVNLELMRQLKKVFDPKNLLNRGKLFD